MAATVPVLGIFKVGIGIKLMHVIPRGKGRGHCMYTIRLRESALEVGSGEKSLAVPGTRIPISIHNCTWLFS